MAQDQFTIYLGATESQISARRASWKKEADRQGLSLSGWIREVCDKEANFKEAQP